MAEQQGGPLQRLWRKLFGGNRHSARHDRVVDYIVHRIGEGANLQEVLDEEYVRRNASPRELDNILDDPRIVRAAGDEMRESLRQNRPR
jgi:hypothetical protein